MKNGGKNKSVVFIILFSVNSATKNKFILINPLRPAIEQFRQSIS